MMAGSGPPPLDVGGLSLAEIDALLDDLEPDEVELSARRRRAHERIDALRAEVRSGAGDSTPASLARLEVWERRLSAERRAIHVCLDALYTERERRRAPARRRAVSGLARTATLVDPDGGRHGTLAHLPPLERPLDERATIGLGPRRPGPPSRAARSSRPGS